jgi:LmbE family N-acetylglucosaminyl deacetylase
LGLFRPNGTIHCLPARDLKERSASINSYGSPSCLFHRLKRLGHSGTVLHAGAHPDDEEIGLLAYVSFKHYGRAVYWSATRGEGGQNRINQYQGRSLGVYRTWESLAARELDGGECLFGPFVDFGFSKTADETFARWGRENLVRQLVYAIRLVQPQVVVSRWSGAREDGHGHHQAVGQALRTAFELAASSASFPELARYGCAPWRPLKMYVSGNKPALIATGRINRNLERDGVLRINTGEYSHLLGRTYQEQAWLAFNRHQTQGVNALPAAGDFYYYFVLIKSSGELPTKETAIFDGLDASLSGLVSGVDEVPAYVTRTLREAEEKVQEALALFDVENPTVASRPLVAGLELLKGLGERVAREMSSDSAKVAIRHALSTRVKEFEAAIAATVGLRLESLCTRGKVTPGESVWVTNRLWNFGQVPIDRAVLTIHKPEGWTISDDKEECIEERVPDGCLMMQEAFIGNDAPLSSPYWLKNAQQDALYDLSGALCQEPLSPVPLSAECEITFGEHSLTLTAPTVHRKSFPGGFRELPLAVVPPISLHPHGDKTFVLLQDSERKLTLPVTARCNDEERPAHGRLTLVGPDGWRIDQSSLEISLPQVDGVTTRSFEVVIPQGAAEGRYDLVFKINCRGRDYEAVLTPVRMGAPGLPLPDDPATCIREELVLSPSRVTVNIVRGQHPDGKKYGYITGVKEDMLTTLLALGLNVNPLADEEIARGELGAYDAIVVGPNGYLVRSEARDNAHRLLEYIRNGGTLVVQYHNYDYQRSGLAPYHFEYHTPHDRVTNEKAPVTMLKPDDPLFHFPNRITPADFDGWIHDRGLYFFGAWDQRYIPLLASADQGEQQKLGGLMKAAYGKGLYFYVGYSLFRQLPAGTPGSFRLFLNLLSQKP